jgi:hypothetical protein
MLRLFPDRFFGTGCVFSIKLCFGFRIASSVQESPNKRLVFRKIPGCNATQMPARTGRRYHKK